MKVRSQSNAARCDGQAAPGRKPHRVRFRGRWVPEGHQDRNATFPRLLLARAWYLLVPFIGIGWANDAHVRPTVEDLRSLKNYERQNLLDRQDQLKAEISRLQSQAAEAEALIDTLYMPQLIIQQATLDEVIRLRMAYDRNPVWLAAEADSLQRIHDYLACEGDDLRAQLNGNRAILANLGVWNAALRDSITTLDGRITDRIDELNRREQRQAMHAALGRFWYLLGPAIGIVWAHES